MRRFAGGVLVLCLSLGLAGCFGRGKKSEVANPTSSVEPDKVLYEKGLRDLQKGRYEVSRLTFQTLLNTYPDSDYKEKAKLAIADSFFKQGGTTGFIQAEAEYKDFMTFFPTSEDADDAQMRIAMTHYLQMEKPDRDRTQAKAAEQEFKAFLEQFPDSPMRDEAAQHLREVQEILADGDLRVSQQYMLRRNYRGAFARAETILREYPDFSRQDEALFALGQSSEGKKKIPEAGYFYGKVVSEHPLSPLVEESRRRLEKLNLPIPDTNPEALARAQAEKESLEKKSFMGRVTGMFSKKPDVSSARKANRPPLVLSPDAVNMQASTPSSPPSPPVPQGGEEVSAGVGVEIINRPPPSSNSGQVSTQTPSVETVAGTEIERQHDRIKLAASKVRPGSRVVFAQNASQPNLISFWLEDSSGKTLSPKSSEITVDEIGKKSNKDLESLIENLLIQGDRTA